MILRVACVQCRKRQRAHVNHDNFSFQEKVKISDWANTGREREAGRECANAIYADRISQLADGMFGTWFVVTPW